MSECGCNHHQELASLRDQLDAARAQVKEAIRYLRMNSEPSAEWMADRLSAELPPPADKGEFCYDCGAPAGKPHTKRCEGGQPPAPGAESGKKVEE